MPSSNPVFGRGFGTAGNGQQYAGWGTSPQSGTPQPYGAPTQDPYAAPSPYAASTTQYMTMDDVVTKTGLSFLVTVATAALVWAMPGQAAWGLALPAVLVAFVLGLVIAFKQISSPIATLSYGALYGVALGAISEAFNDLYPGIVIQALIGTFGVFAGMLVVYKTGAIRVTPKLTRWVVGALIGALVLMVVNFLAAWLRRRRRPGPALRRPGGDPVQPRRDRHRGVLAAARLRHGRRGDPPRRPGEVRLVHRLRPAGHRGLAVHRDPAAAQLLPRVTAPAIDEAPAPARGTGAFVVLRS